MNKHSKHIWAFALLALTTGSLPAGAVTLNYTYTAALTDGGTVTGGFDFNVNTQQVTGMTADLTGGSTPDADTDLLFNNGFALTYVADQDGFVPNVTPLLSVNVSQGAGDFSQDAPGAQVVGFTYTCSDLLICSGIAPLSSFQTSSVTLETKIDTITYDLTGAFSDGATFSASVLYSTDGSPLQFSDLKVSGSSFSDGPFTDANGGPSNVFLVEGNVVPQDPTGSVVLSFGSLDFGDLRVASPQFGGAIGRCGDAFCQPDQVIAFASLSGTARLAAINLVPIVPLPPTIAFLFSGVLGFALLRRKQRKILGSNTSLLAQT
ncbi:hypothetical protein [Algirhabdus cladophorae]|uniref:hypothetical protein n=1 Tax=Algirhabdus cladophorae TaxID=3377108 RepID=UPI003B845867